MNLTNKQIILIKDNLCIFCGHAVNEDLRKWFGKGGKGSASGGGWDRYSSTGTKLGKCGDGEKGDAYAACLSKSKAAKLGKKGIANFVKRKRAAQKKGGDAKKGGEKTKGQKAIKVKTERNHRPNCERKLPGESNAQWRQRCGPRPLGAISMGGHVGEDTTRSSKKGAPGTLKAKIKGPVTIAKAKALKNRKNATAHDKAQANWFINMQRGKREMKEDIKMSAKDMEKLHQDKEVEVDGTKISYEEQINLFLEKNVPTNQSKWNYYKSQAKKKFDVYPSAYANAWAAKKYKAAGGGWKKESIGEGYSMRDLGLSPFFKKLKPDQRQAVSIALIMGGNMSGAVKAIEKIKKGLSKDKKVKNALRMANENKGLWHNINAKKKRGEKSSPKGSKAYKAAKAAGDKLNKQKNENSFDLWAEDGSFGYTMTGIVEAEYQGRKVKLNKPMQGDVKKFKVYVKNDKGNVVKVNF